MKKVLIFLFIIFLSSLHVLAGDTGKYKILNYQVQLTPSSDGKVKIEYYQKWQVTDGHIPWITVGLPNDDFQITGKGLNIRKIEDAQASDWSGVRIDLDKDYLPGQTFGIAFSIIANKLFEAEKEDYHLEFTPGWYDNAFIDTLGISVQCLFKIDKVKTTPNPSVRKDGVIAWQKIKLGKGEKFSVELSFPKKLYAKEIPEDNLKAGMTAGLIILIVIIIIVIILLLLLGASDGDGGYSGSGGIFFGGSGGGGLSGGGGGGFGGSSSSCACVSCACACAGGGGAGCTRKTEHKCPLCKPKRK